MLHDFKVSDKVWQRGLKCKMIKLNSADTITKFRCSFLTNWKAKIKANTNKFKIVPLAVKKKENITINGSIIPYADKRKGSTTHNVYLKLSVIGKSH